MLDNMIERLRTLAASRATDTALVAVDAHGDTRYDYAALDRRAAALAAFLQREGATGERALLLMDSGVDYVASFFGCLYANVIAVPAYPPESVRAHHLARLQAIAADAEACFVLTTRALADKYGDAFAAIAPHAKLLAVDTLHEAEAQASADAFIGHRAAPSDVAFLQYTSGSTSTPKGVMVTHGSLWANEIAIKQGLGVGDDDVFVSWLPLYHDMGLIGSMSQPVFSGIPLVLMSPQYFLERPVRWLEAIARHRGTISGGPDFSYRLCADRVNDELRAALDLSSWRVAFSGSEPVRKATLDAFVERFAASGFDAGALFPCYGLAEATLFVTGVARGAGVLAPSFTAAGLEAGRAMLADAVDATASDVALVSCGTVSADHVVRIVDRQSDTPLEPGALGEILVGGPSVAAGYWRRVDDTARTFSERDGRRWLRTGDLGFLHDGNLYVAGRLKDMLIVRGRNLYPQDLELAIEREVELVRRGRVAAFAVQIDGLEGIGMAAEVSRNMQKLASAEAIAAALTEAIALACGEPAAAVALLNPGGLPRTSSGKVQRAACMKGWNARSLDAYAYFLHGRRLDAASAQASDFQAPLPGVETELAAIWRDALRASPTTRDDSFFALGGNSLAAVQVAAAISVYWQIGYSVRDVFRAPVLKDAAAAIETMRQQGGAVAPREIARLPDAQRWVGRASHAQRSLWLTWASEPASAAYNMSGELRIAGPLQPDALQRAFDTLIREQEILRARFVLDDDGEPLQVIDERLRFALPFTDLMIERAPLDALHALTEQIAHRPFDLESGPLLRAQLVRVAPDDHRLLLTLHHIVADGWSVNLLLASLAAAYRLQKAGASSDIAGDATARLQYADFAAWEHATRDEATLARQLAYWHQQLAADGGAGTAAILFARPAATAAGRQRSLAFTLTQDTSAKLKRFGEQQRASLFMTMLAVLNVALHRSSGKRDIRVGAPLSSRRHAEAQSIVGYCINMQVLRAQVGARDSLRSLVDAARETVLAAHEHQDVPFDRLMSALLPNRARGDEVLFQVKLTEQRPFLHDAFAPLDTQLTVLLNETPHFDLALDFTDNETGIACLLTYDDAVFDAGFAARFANLFDTLTATLLDAPDTELAQLSEALTERVEQGPLRSYPASDVLTLWHDSVSRVPGKIALRDRERTVSFAGLDAAADALAQQLQAAGVTEEARVGVYAERSVEQVLGMLAAFKLGATWVPLDPQLPVARIAAQLADCGAVALLHAVACPAELAAAGAVATTLPLAFVFPDAAGAGAKLAVPRRALHGESAAYLIYTSGSTGKPKGVVVSQRALADYVLGMLDTIGIDADASLAMVSTPSADLGHTTLFGALCSGRTLHLIAPELAFNPDLFAQYMAHHRVDVLKIVPGHLAALLSAARAQDVLPAQALIVGGEATPATLLDRIASLKPACRIFNHYGPTETTVGVAMHARTAADDSSKALPLGTPLPNVRLYVLDERMNRVQPGTPGELYLGGPGVARGYHGQAQLTAERFVPDPFVPGARVYRSGDLAQIGADGMLHYLGRSDDQVKLRGYRVEPAEIERVLRGIEGVRAAAVLAHDTSTGKRLAAFVVGERSSAAVLADAAGLLPDYMVPADLVTVTELPLNANGKLDRAALRERLTEAVPVRRADLADVEAPRGVTEIALAEIWGGVLGVEVATLGRELNFFEAGGDSILGLKVVAKAKKAGLKLTPKQLFERRTLAELAASAVPQDKRADVAALTELAIRRLPDAVRVQTEASYAQQRQWFLWQLSPESSAYHVSGGLRLQGEVDRGALRTSFEAIVARHEVLRTRFVADEAGRVMQWIDAAGGIDWREAELPAAGLDEAARALAAEPFDLTQGPLLRVALFSTRGAGHLLVLSMHHVVSDGWSVQVLLEELVAHYRAAVLGEALSLAPLAVQYADYAAWQRDWLEAGERERQLVYWRAALGDEHPVLALPTDAARPAQASYHAARRGLTLPRGLADAVRAQAQRSSATPFMVLLAAFHALLYRHTGQTEVRTGVPVANRHRVETEGLIGFFVNTQVLASRVDGSTTLGGLLAQVREATLGAQAHQDLPFDVLVDALQVPRSLSHSPLFQVMFNHQRRDWGVLQQLPGMTSEPYRLGNPMAQFELLLDTREEADGSITVEFTYASELFEAQTVERMAGHYEALIAAMAGETVATTANTANTATVMAVSEVALLDAAERSETANWSRNDERYANPEPVFHRFERHAAAHADDVALLFGDTRLSYGELNARANRLAHWLAKQGVGIESKVGVAAERSVEMVVSLLGIMKAGAAYVPLDPSYPGERLAYMQADSGIGLLLCQRGIELPEVAGVRRVELDTLDVSAEHSHNPDVTLHGANLAYVIYTSGSTGRPKGVGNRHDALCNRLEWMQQAYGLQRGETVLQKTPFSFDVSVWEFFWPLMVGARLSMAAPGAHRDPAQLAGAIVAHEVSTLHFVPSMLQAFVASAQASRCAGVLRRIVCSGEALPVELQHRVFEVLPEVELHNLYGPTEAAIDVTSWQCRAQDGRAVPIGAPIAATQTWVLDAHMEPVPRGVAGELYLGGAGLARGYLGRPGLSAERFVPDPFDVSGGARLYRTGDLVRWRADGVLDYLGRLDHQVKIRGFRIELGEIEARLAELPGVRESVVVAQEGRLVAYVTAQAAELPEAAKLAKSTELAKSRHVAALDVADLKAQLSRAMPDYMVPWRIVVLATLPLSANGKVERRLLPAVQTQASEDRVHEAPQGDTETQLAAIWSQLLGVEEVGRHDNFFDLGGDSILGLQIVARARQEGVLLSARQVFEQQTIAQLAACAVKADANVPDKHAATTRIDLDEPIPLLPIQSWFFAQPMPHRHHWNQSVLLRAPSAPDLVEFEQALRALVAHHDCLRLRFQQTDPSQEGGTAWTQHYASAESAQLLHVETGVRAQAIEARCDFAQRALSLTDGPLLRATAMALDDGSWRLFIVIHHLAVDAVSWRLLFGDLQLACAQLADGQPIVLPPRTTSYQAFAHQLRAAAQTPALDAQLDYWRAQASVPAALPSTYAPGADFSAAPVSAALRLDRNITRRLLQDAPAAYRTQINDLLLVALGRVLCRFAGVDTLRIDLEGHGREVHFGDVDLSRTMGWLTTLYPVCLQPMGDLPAALKQVKENLRAVPDAGMGFGILKYLGTSQQRAALADVSNADVVFNYLGQLDGTLNSDGPWQLAPERTGASQDEHATVAHALEVMGQVLDGEMSLTLLHRRGNRYDAATLGALARDLEVEMLAVIAHCTSGASGLTPSDVPLAAIDQARLDALPVDASRVADLYPLAPMQTGIVFHSLLGEQTGTYVNQLRVDIDGLDSARFRAAWETVVARHEVLRTGFLPFDDAPRQWVARHVTLPFVEHDGRGNAAAALDTFAANDVAAGFDIEQPPLLRLALIRTAERRHHFIWTFHHALLDGWSMAQLLAEVLKRYDGTSVDAMAAAKPGRYRDFIAWLAGRAAPGDTDASSESWWRNQLAMLDGPTLLSAALPRPAAGRDSEAPALFSSETRVVDAERTAQWARFAKAQRVTLNTLVQAAWLLLLQRYTGQRAVTFGATVAGRPEALADAQRTLGLFINTIPVVAEPRTSTSVAQWLEQIQQQGVAAREHEHVALYEIQRWAQLEGGQPLFDSIVVFENYPVDDALKSATPQGLTFSNLQACEQTNYPLTLSVTHTQRTQQNAVVHDGLRIDFAYACDVFGAAQVVRIATHLSNLLDAFATNPARLLADVPMLSAPELKQLRSWGDAGETALDTTPVHLRIAAQAHLRPTAEALVLGRESLDYDTLNRRANQIAHRLLSLGVGPESRVGVAIDRSIDMIVALLGVLKAGAAYVPLDPAYPAERVEWMTTDSGIAFALTASTDDETTVHGTIETLDVNCCGDGLPEHDPQVAVHGAQLAYVIYTSGSTGRPKGVGITHASLAQHTDVSIDLFDLSAADRVLQFSTFNFDGFVEQVFPSLCSGAAVVLRGPELWSSERFLDEVEAGQITVADLTTAYWNALAQDFASHPRAASACASLRRVHAGGEAMPADGVRAWRAAGLAHIELANTYGPSEATVTATAFDCAPYLQPQADVPAQISIGTPLGGRRLAVLDARLEPVPLGVAGELHIGGALLARGYHRRPGLTAERFVADPFAAQTGGRLYRTGDIVRWTEQGTLDYLGRADHQVKVRGFRIEPGEIEAQLLAITEVREAAVVAREGTGALRILAYVTLTAPLGDGSSASPGVAGATLRAKLAATLPDYMVPSTVMVLDAMPMSPGGKLDRHALPLPAQEDRAQAFEPPAGEIEIALARIWSSILRVDTVGRQDTFFELGGHSLAAMQVQAALRRKRSLDVPLAMLMNNQPLHAVAQSLVVEQGASQHHSVDDAALMLDLLTQL